MKVVPFTTVKLEEVNVEGARNVGIRWLISHNDKAPNFAMRMFEVEPGGFTPYHNHVWEHEVFVVEGEGAFVTEEKDIPFKAGDVIFADPEMKHQFRNTGDTILRFLCVVPHQQAEKKKKPVNPFAAGRANNC
ncbi:MAG: cupin domain-containing protein [Candidatus Cloacimonetes bacterium]|nr:cupin domain-containing protein [Candidatus Cloacimonadota bacterium]